MDGHGQTPRAREYGRGGWKNCDLAARLALYEGGPIMHEDVVQELSRRGFLRGTAPRAPEDAIDTARIGYEFLRTVRF